MKSIRCSIGIHKEYLHEGFPLDSRSPLIGGVQCDRCKRIRCVSLENSLNGHHEARALAFDQARVWLEKMTGHRIIGNSFISGELMTPNRLTTKQREDDRAFTVSLADDPIWEVGDVRLLDIKEKDATAGKPREYRVVGRTRKDDGVRYELRPL